MDKFYYSDKELVRSMLNNLINNSFNCEYKDGVIAIQTFLSEIAAKYGFRSAICDVCVHDLTDEQVQELGKELRIFTYQKCSTLYDIEGEKTASYTQKQAEHIINALEASLSFYPVSSTGYVNEHNIKVNEERKEIIGHLRAAWRLF
jgi:hypothetical protein